MPKSATGSSKNPTRSQVRSVLTGKKASSKTTSGSKPRASSNSAVPKSTSSKSTTTQPTRPKTEDFTPTRPNVFQRGWLRLLTSSSGSWSKTSRVKHQKQLQQYTQKWRAWLRQVLPGWMRRIVKLALLPVLHPWLRWLTLLAVLVGLGGLGYILRDLPSPRKLTSKENFAVSTQIFDRNGVLLYEIFADEHRVPTTLDQVPPEVIEATIAIEDENFYHHFGIDVVGVVRAVVNNLQGGRLEGGSTITQQLVKNALLTRERSFQRKVKEAVLAMATEVIYSKDQIMEMYLNYIPYGGTAVGIEAAAQQYFDKPVSQLTLAEAALLAGLPQAPSVYSPFGSNPERAKSRQEEVLRQMVENGFITAAEAETAKSEVLQYALSKTDINAPHFVFYVRDLLYDTYGVETVEKGGLRVTTTLDLALQETVQASVSAEVSKLERYRVGNGAAMVIKPNTGEILAMVGSKDYFNEAEDGQVNVTLAQRQPGSSIKPIMYATAFQNKLLNPGTVLLDVPTCFTVPGQKPYCPKNYDGSFKGPVTVRQSLGNSLNIPAVKGLRLIGVEAFIKQATKMGITTWTDPSNYGLSLTLGGGEVRMIDLAQAFAVLANQGVKSPLTPILKIEDYQGKVLDQLDTEERLADLEYLTLYDDEIESGELERVMDRAPAYLVDHIMQDNNARTAAFGSRSELVIPNQVVSVKTGTTNDLKDNWTVGFTPEYLVITWVGNNDSTPMNPYVVSGVTGAAPIFNDVMSWILNGREPVWPSKPSDVASGRVCASGMPPELTKQECSSRYDELYWQKGQPSESKTYTKEIWVKSDTGQPPASGESADNLILETHTVLGDPLTPAYCTDCRVTTDDQGRVQYTQNNTVQHDYAVGSN